MTKLEQYLKANAIKPAHLAAKSGYSRQHILRLRQGQQNPTQNLVLAVLYACRSLSHNRKLAASDLFDL
jgi:hypothetical protein